MSTAECKLYAPNLICICIYSAERGDYTGVLWNQYDDKPDAFHNSIELIQKMDALYDEWDFPQRSTSCRTFGRIEDKPARTGIMEGKRQMDARRVQENKGEDRKSVV